MKFFHPLMDNNFKKEDFHNVIKLLKTKNPILTQSKYVKLFEKKWSSWLGVKYSTFVNSGSSANFLSILALKQVCGVGEIIVPPLTWVSDITSVILNGFRPVFVDINPKTLSMSDEEIIKKINKNTKAVFLSHIQGFNGLSFELLNILKKKKIHLIEDVCESHGARFNGKKLGSYGLMSNFSFYYAHHMSTIEGGMISTNNKYIYEITRSLRSHGLAREISSKKSQKSIYKHYPKLNKEFIFLYPGFNMRNNEIGALIGLNQLKSLDKNIKIRSKNFNFFLNNINSKIYRNDFELSGSSNYAFPLILNKPSFKNRDKLELLMKKNKIEFRRGNAGGGNQLLQPYLKKYIKKIKISLFKNTNHIHNFGYYIGNYPSLKFNKIKKICNILNSLKI